MKLSDLIPAYFFGSPFGLVLAGVLLKVEAVHGWPALGIGLAASIALGLGIIKAIRSA